MITTDINKLHFHYNDLSIELGIIATMMGYKEDVPLEILQIIENEIEVISSIDEFQGGFLIKEVKLLKTGFQLEVDKVHFNVGRTIWNLFEYSEQVALFVSTAGQIVSDRSKKLMKEGLLLEGYVADVIGSVVCEKVAAKVWERLQTICSLENLKVTNRYNPGYCNWDVIEQHSLFSLLPEGFCNIHINESALMLPTKSLSGLIGIGKDVEYRKNVCNHCNSVYCIYRNKKHY